MAKEIDKNLEFILYILLGTLTGLSGLVAALFIAYMLNYKKYWGINIGFLIGWAIYYLFIGPFITFIENLIYTIIIGIIALWIASKIKKDKYVIEPIDLTLKYKDE